jgi:hypothetical protein
MQKYNLLPPNHLFLRPRLLPSSRHSTDPLRQSRCANPVSLHPNCWHWGCAMHGNLPPIAPRQGHGLPPSPSFTAYSTVRSVLSAQGSMAREFYILVSSFPFLHGTCTDIGCMTSKASLLVLAAVRPSQLKSHSTPPTTRPVHHPEGNTFIRFATYSSANPHRNHWS